MSDEGNYCRRFAVGGVVTVIGSEGLAAVQNFAQFRSANAQLLRGFVDGQAFTDDEADGRPVESRFQSLSVSLHERCTRASLATDAQILRVAGGSDQSQMYLDKYGINERRAR